MQAKGADLAVGLQAICSHLGVVEVRLALGLVAPAALLGLCRHAPGAALLSGLAVACLPVQNSVGGVSNQGQKAIYAPMQEFALSKGRKAAASFSGPGFPCNSRARQDTKAPKKGQACALQTLQWE